MNTTIKIRRYYGHDCDSVNGFNNGYYLDDKPKEVKDDNEAMEFCLDGLKELWDMDPDKLTELDNGYQYITQFFDNKSETDYAYVYVTYEIDNDEDEIK